MLGYLLLARERLQSYTVHEKPNPPADRIDRAEALEFVKDGFIFSAFLVPPLWLATRGIWLGVLAYLAAIAAIAAGAALIPMPPVIPALAVLGLHLFFGSEADEMVRAHLGRRGWTTLGQVTGSGPLDCQRRFYDKWLPMLPISTAPTHATPGSRSPQSPPPSDGRPSTRELAARAGGAIGNLLSPMRLGKKP